MVFTDMILSRPLTCEFNTSLITVSSDTSIQLSGYDRTGEQDRWPHILNYAAYTVLSIRLTYGQRGKIEYTQCKYLKCHINVGYINSVS